MKLVYVEKRERYEFLSAYEERGPIRAAGARWDPKVRRWWIADDSIASRFERVACADTALPRIEKADAERRLRRKLSRARDSAMEIPAPEGFSYFPFQRAGIAYALSAESTLIADEMGLGKTIQALGVINADRGIERVLVVCPASLKLNWAREAGRALVRPLDIKIASGKDLGAGRGQGITIVNYDILSRFEKRLKGEKWGLLVADEAHLVKNPKAQRSKALDAIAKRCERKLFLTGTPVVNRPVEIHALLRILKPGLFPNFMGFARRFCDARHNGYGWDFSGHSNLEELQGILRETVMVRRLKADVLAELPPKTRTVIEIPADTKQLTDCVYNESGGPLMDNLKELFGSGRTAEVVEGEEGSRVGDIAQAARLRHATALAKAPCVVDFVTELLDSEGKVIVFAHHRDVVKAIVEGLSEFNPVSITGDTPQQARQDAVDAFQSRDDVRVFAGNIQAAGVGLTLTEARTVVFAELDWVPGNVTQAEDRAHRIGQNDNVNVYHLVVAGTIDAWLAAMIVEKQDVIDRATDRNEAGVEDLKIEGLSGKLPMAYEAVSSKPRAEGLREAGVTEAQAEAAHRGVQVLAGVCDYATSHDNQGFSGADAHFGHMLARQGRLTPRQAAAAVDLCRKYRRQLKGAGILEALEGKP